MLSPLLAALLGLSLLIVGPYASVGKLVDNADRELKQVLVGLQYGRLFAEQSKHFAEYVYLPARSRIGVREEIQAINDAEARTYRRLLKVAGGVEPDELRAYERAHGLYQQLHDAGAAMMRLAEAGRVERAREVLVSRVLPLSDRAVEKLTDVAADDETERNEYLAQAGGVTQSLRFLPGTDLSTLITQTKEAGSHAIAAAYLQQQVLAEVAAYPRFIATARRKEQLRGAVFADRVEQTLRGLHSSAEGQEGQGTAAPGAVDEFAAAHRLMTRTGREVLQVAERQSGTEAVQLFESQLHTILDDQALPALHRMIEAEEEHIGEAHRNLRDRIEQKAWLLALGMVALVVTILAMLGLVSRHVVRPITALQSAADRVRDGDLTARVPNPGSGEIGDLARGFNAMVADLRASRQALVPAKVVAKASDTILVVGRTGKVGFASAAAVSLLRRPHSEIVDIQIRELLPQLSLEDLHHAVDGASSGVSDGRPLTLRLHGQKSGGHWNRPDTRDIEVDVNDLRADPDVAGIVLTLRDVTERNRASQALAESSRRHLQILDAVGEGIYGADREGRVTFVNPAAARSLHYLPEELIGRKAHSLFHAGQADPDLDDSEECHVHAAMGGEQVWRSDKTYLRANGETFPVEVTVAPTYDRVDVSGVVVVFRDISQRRAVERMKEEFISVVSHELRTPLTAIQGSLGLLNGGVVGELAAPAQRMVGIALESSERLSRLINDMLDLERMQSGTMPMELGTHDSHELVTATLAAMKPLAEQAGVVLVKGSAEGGSLYGDADRIMQALTNLVGNAIKFSAPGDQVKVTAELNGPMVTFRVADQGPGIPADKQEPIFNRFEQVDSSDAREKGGTGLGLAITKNIVIQHGGDIWIDSEVGRGSVFGFTIPAAQQPAATSTISYDVESVDS